MSLPDALDRPSFRLLPAAIILGVSLILSIPLFRDGLPYAHDTEEHLQRYACFISQISQGEIYPRWLAKLNCDLGSPVMFVYAPFAYYVPAALRPILHLPIDGLRESREVGVSMWMALAISGLTAFLWLKSFVSRVSVATFGSLLYMAMPYHLAIDLYTRAAVAEVWAFAWMPLILYFASKAVETRTLSAMAKFAISYALLILTHLLTTLIFTPIVIVAALLAKGREGSRPALKCIALSLTLGIGLSAIYLGPALQHENYVSPARLSASRPALSFANNFMILWRGWAEPGGAGDLLWKLSWITLSALAVALVAFTFKGNWSTKMGRFWVVAAITSAAMMFPPSRFLWNAIPQLAAIQFPYRFNTLLAVATVASVTMALDSLKTPLRPGRMVLAAGITFAVLVWIATDIKTISNLSRLKSESSQLLVSRPLFQDVLLAGWSQASDRRFLRQSGILQLSREASVRGEGVRQAWMDRPSAREIQITVDGSKGWVSVPLLFYHGWTATTDRGQRLITRAAATGLMEIEAPDGLSRIHLALPWDWMEKTATAVTIVCALLGLFLLASGAGKVRLFGSA